MRGSENRMGGSGEKYQISQYAELNRRRAAIEAGIQPWFRPRSLKFIVLSYRLARGPAVLCRRLEADPTVKAGIFLVNKFHLKLF
ncbi:hypothetical protein [Acidocella aquatica]|uniref:hypothetical protein n=1 Tax=Acidocella aquatica TaxID=1922313 RepID=UPI0024E09761|nr:hypothetical protein [Acidocella aquatica]